MTDYCLHAGMPGEFKLYPYQRAAMRALLGRDERETSFLRFWRLLNAQAARDGVNEYKSGQAWRMWREAQLTERRYATS